MEDFKGYTEAPATAKHGVKEFDEMSAKVPPKEHTLNGNWHALTPDSLPYYFGLLKGASMVGFGKDFLGHRYFVSAGGVSILCMSPANVRKCLDLSEDDSIHQCGDQFLEVLCQGDEGKDSAAAWKDLDVKVYHGSCTENTIIAIPAGWFYSMCAMSHDTSGVRNYFLLKHQQIIDDFRCLQGSEVVPPIPALIDLVELDLKQG